MRLESGTVSIVQLAWSRRLGLPDDALTGAPGRILQRDDSADVLRFVRLFETSVLSGPGHALEAAQELDDDDLADPATLLRLSGAAGARGLGAFRLYFAEDSLEVVPSDSTVLSGDSAHSRELEELCPPDDVEDARLSTLQYQFVLLTDQKHIPLAGAGFDIWEGILANIRALCAPETRRMGLGSYVAAIALEEALSQGLVPQWQAEAGQTASRRTAETLGFVECGCQTTIRLTT